VVIELQKKLLLDELQQLAQVAGEASTNIFLEPLNRSEAPWLNRLEQAAEICDELQSKRVGILGDFFHMNLEEIDSVKAIEQCGHWIKHVHLADNNRKQPGSGAIHFKANLSALRSVGFKGAMVLECGLVGSREEVLPRCVSSLKALRSDTLLVTQG
jgi:sugar phosphate isomerase/epimerase